MYFVGVLDDRYGSWTPWYTAFGSAALSVHTLCKVGTAGKWKLSARLGSHPRYRQEHNTVAYAFRTLLEVVAVVHLLAVTATYTARPRLSVVFYDTIHTALPYGNTWSRHGRPPKASRISWNRSCCAPAFQPRDRFLCYTLAWRESTTCSLEEAFATNLLPKATLGSQYVVHVSHAAILISAIGVSIVGHCTLLCRVDYRTSTDPKP